MFVCLISKKNWYTCKCTCTDYSKHVYSKSTCFLTHFSGCITYTFTVQKIKITNNLL